MLHGKTVVVGVCGGIAAFKAASLCSKLVQAGAEVKVIMTEAATQFVTPLTFQTISRNYVYTNTFDEIDANVVSHIDLADNADAIVIAPATANMIAKMAHGIADDMLSTTLLAATSQVVVAPAMNVHMYEHPAVIQNIRTLQERGVRFVEPGVGQLACGYVGKGRLVEPDEIFQYIVHMLNEPQPLAGRHVIVTAGGTRERIDPVRYITNDSSGKMGYAIAEEALKLGASVTLITGKTHLLPPAGADTIRVDSTQDMYDAVLSKFDEADIVFKAAAVSDYRPIETMAQKMKKTADSMTLALTKNPDILQAIGERKTHQFIVGFAAETNDVERYAREKLARKKSDLVVANDVTTEGAGFDHDTNAVSVYDASGLVEHIPLASKTEVAVRLLEIAISRLPDRKGTQ